MRHHYLTVAGVIAIALGSAIGAASPAAAQVATTTSPTQTTGTAKPTAPVSTPRWEIEGYGGWVSGGLSLGASHSLPAPGASLTTSSFLFPTRQTPSWFFGDGAAMFNGAAADFGLSKAIVPLDDALQSPSLGTASANFGVRVRRTLTPRWSVEASVDVSNGPHDLSSGIAAAVTSTRDSFTSSFAALLATGPFTGVVVDATSGSANGSSHEIATTGAVNMHFHARGAFVPYITLGGGVITGSGTLPSATLTGDYRFSVLSNVPIHETDRVTIRYARSSAAPVLVVGGGLRRDMSPSWGWRVDGRLLAGGGMQLLLDATPSFAPGTPAGFVESLTNPNLQFSNNTSTGRSSTLGGAPLAGFVAYDEGLRTRISVTIAIFKRF